MAKFSIFNDKSMTKDVFTVHYNTNTIFDLMTGIYVPGVDSKYYLNGGFGSITGIAGVSKRYKSATALSLATRLLGYYPECEILIADSEYALNSTQRLVDLSGNPNLDIDRISFVDTENLTLNKIFNLILDIAKRKTEARKHITIETSFRDRVTGKAIQQMLPTFVILDSLTKIELEETDKLFDKYELGDSKLRMINMDNGNAKTMFMSQIGKLAASANIYFIITAHIDAKFDMGGLYTPSKAKDLQYMRSNEEFKGVGSKFKFYCTACMEARNSTLLLNSDKTESLYPSSDNDSLHEVVSIITRGNNNQSGLTTKMVVSQQAGIQSALTYYHLLKDKTAGEAMFGLSGTSTTQQNLLLPDISMTRRTVREKFKQHPELERAMEIMGQLNYIQTYWSWYSYKDKVNFGIKPEDFAEQVLKGNSVKISDILNSRSYWTYDKSNKKPYMSLIDILLLLQKGK